MHASRKEIHIKSKDMGERIFVDMTSPIPEILIGKRYWIDVVYDYSHHPFSLFTRTKMQLPKKMEAFFEKGRHRVLQLSTYFVIMPVNKDLNFRRCMKNKR